MAKKRIKPVLTAKDAVKCISSGATIMVGGFNYGGIPYSLIKALVESEVNDLTLISNDTAYEDVGQGSLVKNGQVKKVIASHIGLNRATQNLYNEHKIDLELIPQGTFVEKIRAGGFGLGGFLTPTGIGTEAQNGKQLIDVGGIEYILELPMVADVSLIRAYKADQNGNLIYFGTNRNFNPTMATAGKIVIAEVDDIVASGEINPNDVVTPGILIDYLVLKEDSYYASRT